MSYAFEPHTVYSFAIYIIFINVDLDEFRVGVRKDCLQIPKDLAITERLFQMLSDHPDSCNPVVRRIKYGKGGRSFHESRGISYTTAKDMIKKKLGIFFYDLRKLGSHSLGSGGASDSSCCIDQIYPCRHLADGNVFNRKTSTLNL